jgi:hypothetical protein
MLNILPWESERRYAPDIAFSMTVYGLAHFDSDLSVLLVSS